MIIAFNFAKTRVILTYDPLIKTPQKDKFYQKTPVVTLRY